MNTKLDPAHMQDIFIYAKNDFLKSYSYFTEDEYDDMITDFFKDNYTFEEVNNALTINECSWQVQRAYGL